MSTPPGSFSFLVTSLVFLARVCLEGVGKSSILLRFTDDVFDDVAPTIGVDFKVKALDVDGRRVKITAWDTGTFFVLLR